MSDSMNDSMNDEYKTFPHIDNIKKHRPRNTPLGVHRMIITEKYDGTNYRFKIDPDGSVIVGGRKLMPFDNKGWKRQTRKTTEFIEKCISNRVESYTDALVLSRYIYFGESMIGGAEVIYDEKEAGKTPDNVFYGFAAWDRVYEEFVENYATLFAELGMRSARVLKVFPAGTPQDEIFAFFNSFTDDNIPISSYDGRTKIEGMVSFEYGNQRFYKHKFVKHITRKKHTKQSNGYSKELKNIMDGYMNPNMINYTINSVIDSGKYGKNNPVPSVIGHISKNLVEELTLFDVYKILKRDLNRYVSDYLQDNELIDKIMQELEEKHENEQL